MNLSSKKVYSIVSLLSLVFMVSFCVSKNQDRVPSAASKSIVSSGVDQVTTPHGTLMIEWDNGEEADQAGNHRPAYAPVLVKVFVVCKGSNARTEVDSHNVCFYDGYHVPSEGDSKVSIGLRKQLKAPVKAVGNQLQVDPKNDNNCNTPLVQTIDVQLLCGSH